MHREVIQLWVERLRFFSSVGYYSILSLWLLICTSQLKVHWPSCHVLTCHLYILFSEMSLHVFCSCSHRILSFLCCWVLRVVFLPGFCGGPDGKESACSVGHPCWSLGREDPLEKGMASHSSILTSRVPRTEEPGRLQSMGSQRVGHGWATYAFTFTLCIPGTSPLLDVWFANTVALEQHRFELCRSASMWLVSFSFLSRPTLKEWPLFLYF